MQQKPVPGPGSVVALAVVLAVAVLAGAGAIAWWGQAPEPEAVRPSDHSSTGRPQGGGPQPAPAGSTDDAAPPAPAAVRATWVPGAPRSVVVPSLGIDAPVVPVQAPGGTLVPPGDPGMLGWWAAGARPGAERGSALVAGHTVHTGGGALDDLERLRPGDPVTVRTDRGVVRYAVRRVATYSKGAVADHAASLFSQEVPGRLVLVTCEDWDGARYLSNVVVIAEPRP